MKKKTIAIFSIVLLIAMITTVTPMLIFDNFSEAIDYIRNIKSNRTQAIEDARSTIKITSDKLCQIDFDSEEVYCFADYEFQHNNNTIKGRVYLDQDSTVQEDKQKLKETVKQNIKNLYPVDDVYVKVADYNGTTFEK